MQLNSRKSLALLVALVIALLPFRFGHAMDGGKASLSHSLSSHSDVSDCGHIGQTDLSHDCGEHSPDENSFDDCCGDHCPGTQFFVASGFDLQFSASQPFHLILLQRLPESLAVAEYRPPITIS